MHTVFALEDMYGLSVENIDGKICVSIPEPSCDKSFVVSMFLEMWSDIAQEYREGRISKEDYNNGYKPDRMVDMEFYTVNL